MSRIIERPQLPPLEGYVEVVNESGNHVYEKTPELLRKEQETESLLIQLKLKDAQIQLLTTQNEFFGDCMAEMAAMVYP